MRLKSLLFIAAAAILSLAALLLVQCAPTTAEFKLGDASTVIPMTIKTGATSHFMTDYYPQWEGADNVTCNDSRLTLVAKDDAWREFEISTEDDALVSTVEVWHGDQKLSIVVLGGVRDTADSYMSSTSAADGVITIEESKTAETGLDVVEGNGAVHYLHQVEALFLDGTDPVVKSYVINENIDKDWIVVFRPLDSFIAKSHGQNAGLDQMDMDKLVQKPGKLAVTQSRQQYPGMEIDRTVSITPYGTDDIDDNDIFLII